MTFTPELPTKPGAYWWKETEDSKPLLVELHSQSETARLYVSGAQAAGSRDVMGGLWCRLVPAEEVEKAWWEAAIDYDSQRDIHAQWNDSRAKRVMEGTV